MTYLQHALLKNKKRFFLILILLFPFYNLSIFAQSQDKSLLDKIDLTGSVRGSYWTNDKNFTDTRNFAVGSAWLNLSTEEIIGTKFYLETYLKDENILGNKINNIVFREVYIDNTLGDFDFRNGRQIIVWGRADKINPTDNLSVKNYKKLFTNDDDQRLGVFSSKTVFNLNGFRFIGIWIPEWISPVYPIKAQSGISLNSKTPSNPESQFALKIDNSGETIDYSFSYFNGFSKVPNLTLSSIDSNGLNIDLTFDHIQSFGGDFAINLGEFGIRSEIAYTITTNCQGIDYFKQNNFLYAVIGIDRNILENFNLNLQALYRHIYNFQDQNSFTNISLLPILQQQRIITQQETQDQYGFTIRPNYKLWNQSLEIEAAIIYWFNKKDYFIKPKLNYSINDNWKGIIGAEIYGGPNDSFFGELKNASAFFTEVQYLF